VPDFGEACVQRCPQHGRRIVGAQFKPRAEPGLLIIWCVVGEFDAEMAAARKADKEHGLVDAGKCDRLYRAAAKDGLKAPSQFLASMGSREDVDVAAQDYQTPTRPSCRSMSPAAERPPHGRIFP
jgi:hypothetical protein